MKKAWVWLSVFLVLVLSCPMSASAYSETIYLDELDLFVDIPSEYYVVTRDTPADDPVFAELGTTKQEVVSLFEDREIYLNAITYAYGEEVVITMMENGLDDLSVIGDSALDTVASVVVEEYADLGMVVSYYDIYKTSQATFIRLYFSDAANSVYGLQYFTVNDGKAINFTMRSYAGAVSSRQETVIKGIVDSIHFVSIPPASEIAAGMKPFLYTDDASGVSFTVPANWQQDDFTEERDFLDAKFISTKDETAIIVYAAEDVWAQMSSFEKIGYTRADINNSCFTASDIADMYGASSDEVTVVNYNGTDYFCMENTQSTESYGVTVSVTMTSLICCKNGWMYLFQFSQTEDHALFEEFESLLSSVEYAAVSVETTTKTTDHAAETGRTTVANAASNGGGSAGSLWLLAGGLLLALLIVVVAAAVVVVIVLLLLRKKRTRPSPVYEKDFAEEAMPLYSAAPSQPAEEAVVCPNCGQTVSSDSIFCRKCGVRIKKEDARGNDV